MDMNMKHAIYTSDKGFSLIELVVAVSILSILMTFTAITLLKSNPISGLEKQGRKIESLLTLARNKAISTGNQWIFEIDLSDQMYEIANDDGWNGTLTAPNASSEPRQYYTGNPDFDITKRNNGLIEMNERAEGPCVLPDGLQFVNDYSSYMLSDTTIIFNSRGGVDSVKTIWMVDRGYPRPFPYSPNSDQVLHRRKITIMTTGMIKVSN